MKSFNGYVFVDVDLEVGDKAILDRGTSTSCEVIVMQIGQIFARVRSGDMEWSVMLNRLEAIDNEQN